MGVQLFTLLGVILGAGSSFLASSLTERARHRRDTSRQWTEKKLDAYTAYLGDIKQMRALARRIAAGIGLDDRPSQMSREEGLPLLAEAENRRSISSETIALIGDKDTIDAARTLNEAIWRMEWYARGLLRDDDKDGWHKARLAYESAINRFHGCVRNDLGVPGQYSPRRLTEPPKPGGFVDDSTD